MSADAVVVIVVVSPFVVASAFCVDLLSFD